MSRKFAVSGAAVKVGAAGPGDSEGLEQHGSRFSMEAEDVFAQVGDWKREDGNRFEWLLLFGGTEDKVQKLESLPPLQRSYEVLKRNLEDTGLLECELQKSLDKTLIALLVTYKRRGKAYVGIKGAAVNFAMLQEQDGRKLKGIRKECLKHGEAIREEFKEEQPLLDMAEYLGQQSPPKFLKRVVVPDLAPAEPHYGYAFSGLVKEVDGDREGGLPCCKSKSAHHGDTTNAAGMMGRDMGYLPFHQGQNHEHLMWYEGPCKMAKELAKEKKRFPAEAYYGDRFFCSGERQRLIMEIIRSVHWMSHSFWEGKPLQEAHGEGFAKKAETVWNGEQTNFSKCEFLPAGKYKEVDVPDAAQTAWPAAADPEAAAAGDTFTKLACNLPAVRAKGRSDSAWKERVEGGAEEQEAAGHDHDVATGRRDPTLFDFESPDIECVRFQVHNPVRQRPSLLKAVITAFPCVSLPFLVVPLRSHRTVNQTTGEVDWVYRPVYLLDIMPLHNKDEQTWLRENWGSLATAGCCNGWCPVPRPCHPTKMFDQPIEEVRRYFGSETGLYFEWLGMYTKSLVWPAICGLSVYYVQIMNNAESPNDVGLLLVAYALFLALWASLFVEAWKNREMELKFQWGTENVEEDEEVRKEFLGVVKPILREMDSPAVEVVHYPFSQRAWRFCVSGVIISVFVLLVLAVSGVALFMKADGSMVELATASGNSSGSGSGGNASTAPPPPQIEVPLPPGVTVPAPTPAAVAVPAVAVPAAPVPAAAAPLAPAAAPAVEPVAGNAGDDLGGGGGGGGGGNATGRRRLAEDAAAGPALEPAAAPEPAPVTYETYNVTHDTAIDSLVSTVTTASAERDDPFHGNITAAEGDIYNYGGSLISVVGIMILGSLYTSASSFMNNLENHRTPTDATDAKTLKEFFFGFLNNYAVIIYLAFCKVGTFPGTEIVDNCASTTMHLPMQSGDTLVISLPDCIMDINIQLMTVFGAKTAALQTMEIVKPIISEALKRRSLADRLCCRQVEDDSSESKPKYWELQTQLEHEEEYCAFDEFEEMSIQFGFMTLFGERATLLCRVCCCAAHPWLG
eukprot:SAG22_NODE_28_length_28728_cov_19.603619_19_plen_1073_part_00